MVSITIGTNQKPIIVSLGLASLLRKGKPPLREGKPPLREGKQIGINLSSRRIKKFKEIK
jgi:hypothetical protein